jgi:TrmH family RNA methyltransferase
VRLSKSEIGYLRSLSQRKVRDRDLRFLVEGWRALGDALNSDFQIDYVAITPATKTDAGHQTILERVGSRGIALKELSEAYLRRVSDTVHAQGVIALTRKREVHLERLLAGNPSLIVVGDRIADPGNVGSIVRSCDWFGADALILSDGSVELCNEKVIRSTAGSVFHVPVLENANLTEVLPNLKKNGFYVVGTAGDASTSYNEVVYKKKNVIIVGSEAAGLDKRTRDLADAVVCIPRWGKAESLNVGVACGIVLANLRMDRT